MAVISMELVTFAGLYVLVVIGFVFVMLFGEHEWFLSTPVSWAHWLITSGMCQGIEWAALKLCGEKGVRCLSGAETACCQKSNPTVQVLFIFLVISAYYCIWKEVFPMLPVPGVSVWHKYTGTLCTLLCLACFAAASFADAGTITPLNAAAHCALYPPDGQLFEEGAECSSCGVMKPGRSKHCRSCRRCVARFDHHCVWTNNCIGLCNTRWFLAFLLSTAALCAYGCVTCALCIRGDMLARDAWSLAFHDRSSRRLVYVGDSWRTVAAYISAAYTTQAALVFFLGVLGWVVAGFAGYQVYRIGTGVTTNESFKLRELSRAEELQRRLEAQRAQQQAITARILAGDGTAGVQRDRKSVV